MSATLFTPFLLGCFVWDWLEVIEKMERETGFEPATSSLGSWHSTTELLPLLTTTRIRSQRPLQHVPQSRQGCPFHPNRSIQIQVSYRNAMPAPLRPTSARSDEKEPHSERLRNNFRRISGQNSLRTWEIASVPTCERSFHAVILCGSAIRIIRVRNRHGARVSQPLRVIETVPAGILVSHEYSGKRIRGA